MTGSSQKLKSSSRSKKSSSRPPVGWPYDASIAARNHYTIENGGLYTDITFQFIQTSSAQAAATTAGQGATEQGPLAMGAHKALLAASSPVFRAMFESGMKESWTNVVTIAHAQPNVFFQMLEFIYTDVLKATEETILPLMELGHMYIITRLAVRCAQYLKNRLTVDNVCHVLATSVVHNERKLERRCWEVISWATGRVMRTEGFLSLDAKTVKRFAEIRHTVTEESVIWNGCVRWARNQPVKPDWAHLSEYEVLARHLNEVIEVIDFANIPRSDYVSIVARSEEEEGRGSSLKVKGRNHPRPKRRRRPLESYVDRFDDARTNHLRGSTTRSAKTSPDSISFTCSRDILITGVEIYTARLPAPYDAEIEVHEGGNAMRRYGVTVYPAALYENRKIQTARIYFDEDRIWLAKARTVYTVTVIKESYLPDSLGIDGNSRCWAKGVRFEFSNSAVFPWSRSTVSGGQFARFYFHVLDDV